jgi:hypothetical protein
MRTSPAPLSQSSHSVFPVSTHSHPRTPRGLAGKLGDLRGGSGRRGRRARRPSAPSSKRRWSAGGRRRERGPSATARPLPTEVKRDQEGGRRTHYAQSNSHFDDFLWANSRRRLEVMAKYHECLLNDEDEARGCESAMVFALAWGEKEPLVDGGLEHPSSLDIRSMARLHVHPSEVAYATKCTICGMSSGPPLPPSQPPSPPPPDGCGGGRSRLRTEQQRFTGLTLWPRRWLGCVAPSDPPRGQGCNHRAYWLSAKPAAR